MGKAELITGRRIMREVISIFEKYVCILLNIFSDYRYKLSYQFFEAHRRFSCFVLLENPENFQQGSLTNAC